VSAAQGTVRAVDASTADRAALPAQAGAPLYLGQRMRTFCSACRQIFGMPDYERYLEHAARQHPGAPVLSRKEHAARAIERRYGQGIGRCC
jgi:uncharacterized short protein YbdD (DUF466 family)